MKIYSAALVAASMLGALAVSSVPSQAMPAAPGIAVPSAVENVACRWRTTTTWVNGRRVVRRVQTCTPNWRQSRARACHIERVRVVTPSGRVTWRTREVCRPRWR